MEGKQTINCDITTCMHQNNQSGECNLQAIKVCSVTNMEAKAADESMCASYMTE